MCSWCLSDGVDWLPSGLSDCRFVRVVYRHGAGFCLKVPASPWIDSDSLREGLRICGMGEEDWGFSYADFWLLARGGVVA